VQQVLIRRVVLRDERREERGEHDQSEDRDAPDEARRAVPAATEAAAVLDELRLGEDLRCDGHLVMSH
jgi:hypothetical protein